MTYAATKPQGEKPKRAPQLAKLMEKLIQYEQAGNVAEMLEQKQLDDIGQCVEREYQIDKASRLDWEQSAEKAMDVALQVRQPKNYPFQGAANIKYPLVTVAALQFGARAYPAIVDGNRIVKGQVLGKDNGVPQTDENGDPRLDPLSKEPLWIVKPGIKKAKADRVSQHMSYQLTCEMEEWEEDTDVLLHHLPIVGCAFRKVWRSAELGRNKAEMVPAIHLVVNNKVRSLDEAPRVTHEIFLYPQDIEERKRNETFLDVELPAPTQEGEGGDEDAPHMFLEQHRYMDLDEDGYREPYIVTVHKDSCKVVRIAANYDIANVVVSKDDKRIIRIPKEQYFVKYSFLPDPKGGFYDIGFGKLLESLSETIDTTINQMLDAGHLQNAGGGFVGSGVRLKKKEIKVSPGRFEQVEVSGDIRSQIYAHEHPGASPVLFQLLGMMIEAARDITAVKDILTGDSGTESPQTATTTLALIEQGLKVFTAIYKRVYRALKREFALLAKLNSKHLDQQEYYTFLDQQQVVAKEDYDLASMDVAPVADPKMVTDMQKSARANVLMQIQGHPVYGQIQDPRESLQRIYDSLGIEEADKLIPKQQGPSPVEELQVRGAAAEVAKTEASARKETAVAAKTELETALLPHDKAMEARKLDHQEASAAHGAMLGEASMVVDAEDRREGKSLERERMSFEAQERELERQAAAEREQAIEPA
jgi:chaperonin GroES